ncbi:MAG: hypothetical protein R3C53_12300 [Pirellulaceae bacterium]
MVEPALLESVNNPDNTVECELRIVWGGPVARPFEGLIGIDGGTLYALRNLSLQADSIGTIRPEGRSKITILRHSPSLFGGVDLLVRGELDSKLSLQFMDPFTNQTKQLQVALRDVMQGNWLEPLDDRGTRCAIERQTHDRLRVESQQSAMVNIGEAWQARVTGYRTGLPAGPYTLTTNILRDGIRAGEERSQQVVIDQEGSFPTIECEFVPADEAAYLIEFSLRRKRLGGLVNSQVSLTRRTELIALDPAGSTKHIIDWKPVLSYEMHEAASGSGRDWFSSLSELQRVASIGAAARGPSAEIQAAIHHGELGTRELDITPAVDDPLPQKCLTVGADSWIALPLTGLQEGVPHRLQVRVPTDQPLHLAISIRTPGSDGELPALSPDWGFVIDARECANDGRMATHEIMFWPGQFQTYLLFANMDHDQPASIVSLALEAAEVGRFSAESTPSISEMLGQQRMVGLYLDKPLIAEGFSTAGVNDPVNGRPLCSLSTWFDATERLGQYMHWAAADTLVLKVYADGGAIFPSQRLDPSRRFDNGTFFTDGRSPDIKDCVELLLRRFDRDGQRLILAIDFDSALPALARWDNQPGLLKRDIQGNAWPPASPHDRTRHVRYNPLDSRVQAEIGLVIGEISQRYAGHRSFAGIALQLDQDSHMVFAGDKWCVDPQILQQFASAVGVHPPKEDQLQQWLGSAARLAFLNWRAQEMTKFYSALASTLATHQPGAKLYLNAVRLWERLPDSRAFIDPEAILRSPSEYLMAYGIDVEGLATAEHVVLMNGSLNRFREHTDSQDWMLKLSSVRALQNRPGGLAASVVVQQPVGSQLLELERLASTSRNSTSNWIFPHASGWGDYARKELISQLYYNDSQLLVSGGWLPVAGQEPATRSLYQALRQFPPITLDDVQLSDPQSNVRVRQGVYHGKMYVQIVNNAPWSETIKLRVQGNSAANVRQLGSADPLQSTIAESQLMRSGEQWEWTVPPLSLRGLEVDDPTAKVMEVGHGTNAKTITRLAKELQTLEEIIVGAGDPAQRSVLSDLNGDFEDAGDALKPRGWSLSMLPGVKIYRTNELPHSGRSSLVIENESEASAWIQSQSITPPASGRLAVHAWLRAPTAAKSTRVRLSVIGRLKNGERYERWQFFGEDGTDRALANDWGRRPAVLVVADVPTQELTDIQVAIDLVGPGKIWVDDVEIFELRLHPDERIYLRGQVLVAKEKLAAANPYPAELLLDSHWGHYLSKYQSLQSQGNGESPGRMAESPPHPLQPQSQNDTKPVIQQWRDGLRGRWRR